MACVLMDQARRLLSETFTAHIQQMFTLAAEQAGRASRPPALVTGPAHAGHDPLAVPRVPASVVKIRAEGREEASVSFTYKVEYDQAPRPVLLVRKDWLRQVVRRDHVVLAGWPVLDVLTRDELDRPESVLVAVVGGYFDTALHGWRAHAGTQRAVVLWHDDAATVRFGAGVRGQASV